MTARRIVLVNAPLLACAFIVFLLQVGTGEYAIPPLDVAASLFGYGRPDHDFIVHTLRLPRALIGFLVGACLAASGAVLQAITRNPLASPGVVGLNAGASLAAVAVIVWLDVPLAWLTGAAFAGALLVAAASYAFAWRQGISPIRLVLVGIGIAALCQGLITLLTVTGSIRLVNQAAIWMTGSLYGRGWEHFWPYLPWALLFLPLAWIASRKLDLLRFEEPTVVGAGMRLHAARSLLLVIAVALAGSSVATAGTVGFVGLMAPHLARRLVGHRHAVLLPTSAVLGGALVLLADFAGRTVFAPAEIPCGLITALLGGPYMVYLLVKEKGR